MKVFALSSVVVSDGVDKWVLEKGKEYDLPDDVAQKVIEAGAASEVLPRKVESKAEVQSPGAKPAETQYPEAKPKKKQKVLAQHRTNLNTIRGRINKFFVHSDHYPYLRPDNVVEARRWNPETKKMERHRIGVFDEDVERLLSNVGIVLKGRKLCYKKLKKFTANDTAM
jgi:hypothetical protein